MAFIASHGDPIAIGVEGTFSYGVGITATAVAEGLLVLEVIRPERAERRRRAKSDPIDAYQAARAALGNHGIAPAKNAAAIEVDPRAAQRAAFSDEGTHLSDAADPRPVDHRTDGDPGEVP